MNILIVDTSTDYLYVKFYNEKENIDIFEKSIISHNNHSENLLPVIEEGLKLTQMKLSDFQEVIVGKGPGSYTGLRIGMVVCKMMAFTLNIPLYTISSLQFIGSGYLERDGLYAIKSVAKKDYCYGTIIKVENNKITILVEDSFMKNDDFINLANEHEAFLIEEKKYLVNSKVIKKLSTIVTDIHNEVPNYLRVANS